MPRKQIYIKHACLTETRVHARLHAWLHTPGVDGEQWMVTVISQDAAGRVQTAKKAESSTGAASLSNLKVQTQTTQASVMAVATARQGFAP